MHAESRAQRESGAEAVGFDLTGVRIHQRPNGSRTWIHDFVHRRHVSEGWR